MARSGWSKSIAGLVLAIVVSGTLACAAPPTVANWDPAAFRALDTLEFRTVGPEEGEHWSTVWLVVLDDQVYIRLGSRAEGRMQRNTTAPIVPVRIGGRTYERVRAEEAVAMKERVAAAMREKYWTDVFVRYVEHPLTMRLQPEAAEGGKP